MHIRFLNEKEAELTKDFTYETDTCTIIVKKGTITDGASIPKVLWSLVGSPFTGNHREASFIHDALYKSHVVPKSIADELFKLIMIREGENKISAYLKYIAVKLFGTASWVQAYDKTYEKVVSIKFKGE